MARLRTPVLLLALAAAGCGGGEAAPERATTTPAPQRSTPAPQDPLALPDRVPREGSGPADPGAERVVRRWLRALSSGDNRRAARSFALPSKVQNGTPVLTIDTAAERVAINASLPCGGRPVDLRAAGRYTIVAIRLQRRPGFPTCPGSGNEIRVAVAVRGDRISELYTLPEGDAPAGEGTNRV